MIATALLLLAAAGQDATFFQQRVEPILRKHCIQCHNHELDDGGVSFEDRATLLRKRPNGGPAVVLGAPEQSPLVRAIRHDGDKQMPPGQKLGRKEIAVLVQWIKLGLPWSNADSTGK